MLSNEEISDRNSQLIAFISALELGIRIIDLPHKPKFVNHDYTVQYSAYVDNFHLILTEGNGDTVHLDIRLKPLRNMDVEELKPKVVHWLNFFQHNRIYTLKLKGTGMYLCGFNHHNKILKKNPYPVFSEYDPLTYYELERAESTRDRFSDYELEIV